MTSHDSNRLIHFENSFAMQTFSLLASCVYWASSLPKEFVESLKRNFLPQVKRDKLKNIFFPEVRSKILRGLRLLSGHIPFENKLPWTCDQETKDLFQFLRIRGNYIRSQWLSFPTYRGFFDYDNIKFERLNVLALYPDFPLPSLFDFDRFVNAFPKDIRDEYRLFHEEGLSNSNLEGKQKPGLFEINQSIIEMQTEWAGNYFIQPLNFGSEDESFFFSIYNFSGHLIGTLLIITEMLYSIESGLSFHSKYAKKLTDYINTFFDGMMQSRIKFADLLFLHGAIEKCWAVINGGPSDAWSHPFKKEILFSSKITEYQAKAPIFEQFKTIFSRNPISPFLRIDFLCDMKLIDHQMDGSSLKIGCVFENKISNEVLFFLANHTFSGLMAPYLESGETCFGTVVSSSKEELFKNRISCIGRLLVAAFEEMKENQDAKKNLLLFCFYFYGILFREWLLEYDVEHAPSHPLPKPDVADIPEQILLSHFSISNQAGESRAKEVLDLLKGGKDFSDVAQVCAQDGLVRHSGGYVGWVKLGDFPSSQEPALFSFQEGHPFLLSTDDAFHFFLIHEKKRSGKTSFLKISVQSVQTKQDEAFKSAYRFLLEPAERLMENLRPDLFLHVAGNEIDSFVRHYQKALPYMNMIRFSGSHVNRA